MLFLRSLLITILIPGTVLVVIPGLLTDWGRGRGFGVVQGLSLVPIAIGAAIMAWCIRDFAVQGRGTLAPVDPPRQLVDRGLYGYVRNPMYLGGLLILLGESAFYQSGAVLLFGAAWFTAVNLFVVFYEEPTLRRLFGESYAQYCRTVPRWLPRRVRASRTLLALLVVIGLPSMLIGQAPPPRADIPGVYRTGECGPAPFPAQLPAVEEVFDTAALASAFKTAGLAKQVTFGVLASGDGRAPRVHVIERRVSRRVAELAARAVDSLMQPIGNTTWMFRLQVEANPVRMTLDRSSLCAASPIIRRMTRDEVHTGTRRQLEEVRADIERRLAEWAEKVRRLGFVTHRVLVDADGHVQALELVRSSGDQSIDAEAASRWRAGRFRPTKLDGVAVTAWVAVQGNHGLVQP